jgi:hypothetical protein
VWRLWDAWVARCVRPIDARPAALVRILVPAVAALDQLRLGWLGLIPVVYREASVGGLLEHRNDSWYILDDLFGERWGGPVGAMVVVVCLALASLGIRMRACLLLGVFAWGQLAHGFPETDNGGDRIARTALLILAFSGADRAWSLSRRGVGRAMAAWPVDLIRWLLFLVYVDAGVGKLFPRPNNWLGSDHVPITYRILSYPLTSRADPAFWWHHLALFHWLDVATIGVEVSAVILLTRWRGWWGLAAAPIHLGILLFMEIDVFAGLMLGLYPLLFDRWLLSLLDAWSRHSKRGLPQPSAAEV